MHDFEYCAPVDLQEAIALKAAHGRSANLLAGGTDLLIFMRAGRERPTLLIDAKKIPELSVLQLDAQGLTIGANVNCRNIYENDQIAEQFPILVDSTTLIGGIQIQGRASIGGNLCTAAPSADTIPTLIVHQAVANVMSENGARQVPVEEFCIGPGQTVLDDNEILVSIFIPTPPANAGSKFLRFIPRNEMDIAVANAAAFVELDESGHQFVSARVAIGAVAPTPLFVEEAGASLTDRQVDEESILNAARIAREAARPIDDMRGTVEHRKQLVEVLTRRALEGAIERARGGQNE